MGATSLQITALPKNHGLLRGQAVGLPYKPNKKATTIKFSDVLMIPTGAEIDMISAKVYGKVESSSDGRYLLRLWEMPSRFKGDASWIPTSTLLPIMSMEPNDPCFHMASRLTGKTVAATTLILGDAEANRTVWSCKLTPGTFVSALGYARGVPLPDRQWIDETNENTYFIPFGPSLYEEMPVYVFDSVAADMSEVGFGMGVSPGGITPTHWVKEWPEEIRHLEDVIPKTNEKVNVFLDVKPEIITQRASCIVRSLSGPPESRKILRIGWMAQVGRGVSAETVLGTQGNPIISRSNIPVIDDLVVYDKKVSSIIKIDREKNPEQSASKLAQPKHWVAVTAAGLHHNGMRSLSVSTRNKVVDLEKVAEGYPSCVGWTPKAPENKEGQSTRVLVKYSTGNQRNVEIVHHLISYLGCKILSDKLGTPDKHAAKVREAEGNGGKKVRFSWRELCLEPPPQKLGQVLELTKDRPGLSVMPERIFNNPSAFSVRSGRFHPTTDIQYLKELIKKTLPNEGALVLSYEINASSTRMAAVTEKEFEILNIDPASLINLLQKTNRRPLSLQERSQMRPGAIRSNTFYSIFCEGTETPLGLGSTPSGGFRPERFDWATAPEYCVFKGLDCGLNRTDLIAVLKDAFGDEHLDFDSFQYSYINSSRGEGEVTYIMSGPGDLRQHVREFRETHIGKVRLNLASGSVLEVHGSYQGSAAPLTLCTAPGQPNGSASNVSPTSQQDSFPPHVWGWSDEQKTELGIKTTSNQFPREKSPENNAKNETRVPKPAENSQHSDAGGLGPASPLPSTCLRKGEAKVEKQDKRGNKKTQVFSIEDALCNAIEDMANELQYKPSNEEKEHIAQGIWDSYSDKIQELIGDRDKLREAYLNMTVLFSEEIKGGKATKLSKESAEDRTGTNTVAPPQPSKNKYAAVLSEDEEEEEEELDDTDMTDETRTRKRTVTASGQTTPIKKNPKKVRAVTGKELNKERKASGKEAARIVARLGSTLKKPQYAEFLKSATQYKTIILDEGSESIAMQNCLEKLRAMEAAGEDLRTLTKLVGNSDPHKTSAKQQMKTPTKDKNTTVSTPNSRTPNKATSALKATSPERPVKTTHSQFFAPRTSSHRKTGPPHNSAADSPTPETSRQGHAPSDLTSQSEQAHMGQTDPNLDGSLLQ
jgi:hypothetical protein